MAIFHLDVKTGTRGGGQSASAKFDYLGREGRYSKEAEELEYKESGNMPAWAEDDPGKYWQAADEHERVNGQTVPAGRSGTARGARRAAAPRPGP